MARHTTVSDAERPGASTGAARGVGGGATGFEGVLARLDRVRLVLDDLRVREHLRRAEAALRESAAEDRTLAQQRRRRRQLDRLRAYWQRGRFPRNDASPDRVPCFVGAVGTDCAVGYLLREAGRGDLADRIAETDRTVGLEDLGSAAGDEVGRPVDDDPDWHAEFDAWLDRNGLDLAEAARIQPTYGVSVEFATTCGPLSCRLAAVLSGLVATACCAGLEYLGYRLVDDCFPGNVLKRRAALGYLTVLILLALPLLTLLLYALFP